MSLGVENVMKCAAAGVLLSAFCLCRAPAREDAGAYPRSPSGKGGAEPCEGEGWAPATDAQIQALSRLNAPELEDFLKHQGPDAELRVEALRLLVERTGAGREERLLATLLASLKSPARRERETAMYYLSRFGRDEHVDAIEASAQGMDEHYRYSVRCTVNQIRDRGRDAGRGR
jgi:hypothetical protein